MNKLITWFLALVSFVLIIGSWQHWLPFGLVEVFGFVTGGLCVWLTVKENIWNWPVGIANAAFYVYVFFNSKLFADMGLQVVYIILGFLGWYWWLYGGKNKSELSISNVPVKTLIWLGVLSIVTTYFMTQYLASIGDVAPFLDALTTVLSLVAQYLLTKKYFENWYVWISADIIYIGLYFYKDLYLTAILYFIFLCMCISGLVQWKRTLQTKSQPESLEREVLYVQ